MKKHSLNFSVFLVSSAFLLMQVVVSCGFFGPDTVIPVAAVDTRPSFDGNKQDSGLISVSEDGALVTSRLVERYNAMIDVYGSEPEFLPPLKRNQGVGPATPEQHEANKDRGLLFVMEKGALANFIKMNQWRKMGREPHKEEKSPGVISRVVDAVIPP